MSYQPPSGWIETRPESPNGAGVRRLFHRDERCELIRAPRPLVGAVRPGAASRCPRCANSMDDAVQPSSRTA